MVKKRVSIKDIAEIAGVSHPTVSRALRGQGRMSDETRARIVAVAEEVGYTPSMMARGLVTKRSYSIGLIVPTFINAFNSAVAQGIEYEARKRGYSLFLASTDMDKERELEVVRSFLSRQVDGIIVSSGRVGDEYAAISTDTSLPIVLINANTENSQAHAIYHDDFSGALQLVDYLISQNYTRIAYLGAQKEGRSHVDRLSAWQHSMKNAKLQPAVSVDGIEGTIEGGTSGCEKLLIESQRRWQAPPEAIFCCNDMMAIGVMSVLRKHNLRIPQDVAVTGFDDIEIASVTDPPLTTVRQPMQAMGQRAMELLLDLMNPEKTSPEEPIISYMPGELVVRDSA